MMLVLPAPVAPTMATLVPGRDVEAHVAQHRLVGVIGEMDVAELDVAAHRRQRRGFGRIH